MCSKGTAIRELVTELRRKLVSVHWVRVEARARNIGEGKLPNPGPKALCCQDGEGLWSSQHLKEEAPGRRTEHGLAQPRGTRN